MTFKTWSRAGLPALLGAVALALPALAQDAAPAAGPGPAEAMAAAVQTAASTVNKGDVAWMMTSSLLVLLMIVPGLALFYGGLVRAKNMLSILMQVLTICAVMMVIWVLYGYSLAFNGGNAFIGDFGKAFLAGVTPESLSDTFTKGVQIPEYVFICFQMTFAAITPALAIGAFAERIKFPVVILFSILWATFVYFPIAHMVWGANGYLLTRGALDFAGGTVVHINAGIAGLVGAIIAGKRIGFGTEQLPPHSLVMTLIGAGLLWVGWFGFNVGSNLEANAFAGLVMINTFVATAGAVLGWLVIEWLVRGKPSMLGGVSGAIAGLVAITPACGSAGPLGAIVLGAVAGIVCFFFCTTVKNAFGYDDSLDVFGVHGVGGILGAIATGIVVSPALGGVGKDGYDMATQVMIQAEGVAITLLWSGIASVIIFTILKIIFGLRPTAAVEREGLDINEHGERAYHS